ncbi:MAG: adenylate/guanylate cyclase domain-containing protein, partial [Myxococcota bacterium]
MDGSSSPTRLAAIMNGDVAGYTRLMADDEEATAARVATCRSLVGQHVEAHRGRLVDFTGDNFLAELPSASDAVGCGIEIQRALHEANGVDPQERWLELRIGVHLGDLHDDGERVYGAGVNVAARLQQLARPGHLCISGAVHDVVKGRLDVVCEDLGQQRVKNVPEPIRAYHVDTQSRAKVGVHHPASRGRRLRRAALSVVAAVAGLALLGWATWPLTPRLVLTSVGLSGPPAYPAVPAIPSIVVLPFDDMSPEPSQRFFADGLTEAITNKLAGLREIFVISRNSAFTYRGRQVPVAQIGRELGVRYVLEGSVQRAGNRVRVTAQLIDAPSDFHVWSEAFDREMEDVFAVQSEITEQILAVLEVEIREAELARIRKKPTEDLSAYDAFVHAEGLFLRFTRADNDAARAMLERVLTLDPDYAQAHGLLAGTYQAAVAMLWDPRQEYIAIAERHARRAVQLDPMLAQAHRVLAHVYGLQERWDDALREAEIAIELAPNDELAHITRFRFLANQGDLQGTTASTRRAMRLNPRSPSITWSSLAFVHAAVGDRQRA